MAITKGNKISSSVLTMTVIFGTIGSAMLISDLLDYKQGIDSRKWIPVDGKIKTQSVRLDNRDGGVNHFILNAGYVYHVGDQAFRSDRVGYPNQISFTGTQTEKSPADNPAKSMFAKYSPDASITVFYNPSAKEQSTLTRGASARRYLPLWLRDTALLVIAAGLGYWCSRLKKKKLKPD